MKILHYTLLSGFIAGSSAFAPISANVQLKSLTSSTPFSLQANNQVNNDLKSSTSFSLQAKNQVNNNLESPSSLKAFDFPESNFDENTFNLKSLAPLAVASVAIAPMSAEAATGTSQVASAFVAYGHYLSLFVMVGSLMFERLTIEPNMSKDTEKTLVFADAIYGASAVALLVSGYFRAVDYGKGWSFYSHEPIFWVKMIFFCILGSASLFPTITSIKRFVAAQGDSWEPMSDKLASRMKSVINAELVMMGSIPLSATLMSRGVGYTEAIPFEIIGPVLTALTAVGLGIKYAKEAITWEE